MGNNVSAAFRAAEQGDVARILALVSHDKSKILHATDELGRTPLYIASQHGQLAVAAELLKLGADPSTTAHDGTTALHAACLRGHDRVVEAIARLHNAPLNATDHPQHLTPLHHAATGGFAQCCRALCDHGANVNAADASGVTPAHLAAARGHMQALEQLLMQGAHVDDRDSSRRTPLHHAAAAGHLQCVLLLMAHGANPLAVDAAGNSPGALAWRAGHTHIGRLIDPTAGTTAAAGAGAAVANAPMPHAPAYPHPDAAAANPAAPAANPAALAANPAAPEHHGAADADWADVVDAEADAEGGWGVGPAEAAQMMRDELDRQAKQKTIGQHMSAASAGVWRLLVGAVAGGHGADDASWDDDEYDEHEAFDKGAAAAAQRMAALEAEVDRLEGWVRGQPLSNHPPPPPQQSARLPTEGQPARQVVGADSPAAEIAFLRQQLEALQRCVATQPAVAAPVFIYAELHAATNGFDPALRIGQGAFGEVYRGTLHHTAVAVKVLTDPSDRGMQQWRAEVDALARARHPHVVLLLGCCPERGCLVYEYMEGGSLLNALPLREARIKVALDAACGLLALHAQRPIPILHRDVKPANVLLDGHMVAKLGDAGLARLAPELAPTPPHTHNTAHPPAVETPAGTPAYIDPEYWRTGRCTPASDVYALGVTMVQILTGMADPTAALQAARAAVAGRRGESVLACPPGDPVLAEDGVALLALALQCCEDRAASRPGLEAEVVPVLTRAYHTAAVLTAQQVAQRRRDPPAMFVCPITQEVMRTPVVCADGFTYEKEAIAAWLRTKDTSPMTNARLPHKQLTPNFVLRSAIAEWELQPGQ